MKEAAERSLKRLNKNVVIQVMKNTILSSRVTEIIAMRPQQKLFQQVFLISRIMTSTEPIIVELIDIPNRDIRYRKTNTETMDRKDQKIMRKGNMRSGENDLFIFILNDKTSVLGL